MAVASPRVRQSRVEWAGSNAQQDRLMAVSAQKLKTLVVFGPMINSPPAHPDTVITTLVNLKRAQNSVGMQYTHITVDLQLYQTACLVQWNDPLRWTNVILHPGMMHTLMSFLGCMNTDEGIWRLHSHQRSVCWHHKYSKQKGLDQWSTLLCFCNISTRMAPRHMRSLLSIWRQLESTRPGGYGGTALSSLH